MLPAEGRVVVLLCGPAGAGKTTAARDSGLQVYDRDDPHWPDEKTFRAAISRLATQPAARAVVIRSGATSTARDKACALIGATHAYLLVGEPEELAHRIASRRRDDTKATLASLKPWFAGHDRDDLIEDFPGWDNVSPEPNVLLPSATTPAPTRAPRPKGATPSRTGRPWSRIKARVIRRDGGVCHLCGKPGADTADHLVPVSLGGAIYSMGNLSAAHVECNRIRSNRPIEVARAELMPQQATASTWQW